MSQFINEIVKMTVMGFIVPVLLLSLAIGSKSYQPELPQKGEPAASESTSVPKPVIPTPAPSLPSAPTLPPITAVIPTLPQPTQPEPQKTYVSVLMDGGITEMELEEYLLGVMLAEVPATFDMEALKAQAVASRTYTLRCCTGNGTHGSGAVCTKSACCQAYLSAEDYLYIGGKEADLQKIRQAIEETAGQVLTYEGKLILATYFSCSGGSTEDALAVWGRDYPYLQAVQSPGEEQAAVYADTVIFTLQQFQKALGTRLPGEADTWFGGVIYTDGGGVKTMEIGGVSYRGTTLRSLLGLRSTAFTVEVVGECIQVKTLGYGHRVGMSQYGAEAMALRGSSYRDILQHYYGGTSLAQYAV